MKLFVYGLILLISSSLYSQSEYTIAGYVKEKSNGEALIGATIRIPSLKTGAYTNSYGFFSITLPEGSIDFEVSYLGFERYKKTIKLNKDIKLNVEMEEKVITSGEVIITAEADNNNISSLEMSTTVMSTDIIKKMPALLGEVDIIKSIQLLPGVSTLGEGTSGFNVRGGGVDQNLVLLDEAPVYNSSHLFGFFSVFNPDAVKDVKLIKGGIPANYGGRLSSILDVRLKEGNSKEYEINGGIGAIFSRFAIEGPIIDDKLSFLVAGRRSYIDFLAKPFLDKGLKDAEFYFYDLTAKANYKIDDNNTVFLSGYWGRDVFGLTAFEMNWGSQTVSTRWNHIFGDKLFSNLTYYYSNYDYFLSFGKLEEDGISLESNIITQSLKYDFEYFINTNNTLLFGLESIHYNFMPGQSKVLSNGKSVDLSLRNKLALVNAVYMNYESNITDNLKMKLGLRTSLFSNISKGEYSIFGDTIAGKERPLIESRDAEAFEISKWNSLKDYLDFQPRFSLNYILNKESSIKASYNRMTQYLHLVSNTAAPTPMDLWTPSTNQIKPELADQVALGYFRNFEKNEWETSIEVYYKKLQNQIAFIDGAEITLVEDLYPLMLTGEGRAYGAELYIKKNKGDFTGWISYTLSRTEKKIDGISNNDWFASRFDKTHDISLVLFYDINENWSLSSNFLFATGAAATFPSNRMKVAGTEVAFNQDGKRNADRLPNYHRLDLAVTYKPSYESADWWNGHWVFSVVNLYNRRNAFSVYPEIKNNIPQMTQMSVIGSIMPSISYNFNLNFGKK